MYRFLTDTESQLQARTVVNYAAALQWHLVYLRYFLHPDTETVKHTTERLIQKAIRSSNRTENAVRHRELKECMKKIKTMMAKSGVTAERQVVLRNGKEALQARGKWLEMDFMTTLKKAIDVEGWARMKGLEARLELVSIGNLIQVWHFLLFVQKNS